MTELKSKSFWRAVLGELVGMTLFIFLSIAAAIGNGNNENPDQEVKVSLAFGLSIATLAQSLGHISGAHLNPAVTLGMLVSCQISLVRAAFYILAQMLGSSVASGILYSVRPVNNTSLGVNAVSRLSLSNNVSVKTHDLRRTFIWASIMDIYLIAHPVQQHTQVRYKFWPDPPELGQSNVSGSMHSPSLLCNSN